MKPVGNGDLLEIRTELMESMDSFRAFLKIVLLVVGFVLIISGLTLITNMHSLFIISTHFEDLFVMWSLIGIISASISVIIGIILVSVALEKLGRSPIRMFMISTLTIGILFISEGAALLAYEITGYIEFEIACITWQLLIYYAIIFANIIGGTILILLSMGKIKIKGRVFNSSVFSNTSLEK